MYIKVNIELSIDIPPTGNAIGELYSKCSIGKYCDTCVVGDINGKRTFYLKRRTIQVRVLELC